MVVTRGKEALGEAVKGIKYTAMDGDMTLGGKCTMQYIDYVLQNCTLETIQFC